MKMRSAMPEVARLTVGHTNANLLGKDNRALQAAVDYSHPDWKNWTDVSWYRKVNQRFLPS